MAFSIHLGITNSIVVELWAIWYGLSVAWDLGLTHIHLEFGSFIVVQWLQNKSVHFLPYLTNLLTNCRFLLKHQWQVKLKHVYLEANGCADKLEDKGTNQQ